MRDRYLDLIEQIITATLKGQIRSKEQVYQRLTEEISPGLGEVFEQCLLEQIQAVETQLKTDDELKQAKATRRGRALKTIQTEWERWQTENRGSATLQAVMRQLQETTGSDRLMVLLQAIDPNQPDVLSREQMQQLATMLQQSDAADANSDGVELGAIATGLQQGLTSWQQLEGELVSWIYEQSRASIGFGGAPEQQGPWASWAKHVTAPLPQHVFRSLALHQQVTDEAIPAPVALSDWLDLVVVLQRIQQSLVGWFDRQPYDPQAGKKLSIATFLTFTALWSQLSDRFSQVGQRMIAEGCFQVTLQVLRSFAQQPYFPLYGGIFASLSGNYLRTTLDYLDQPLKRAENTQEKARILTLLGYSQRVMGRYDLARRFHQEALDLARQVGDTACEIANLNHLSRIDVAQQQYSAAINTSQRALILARQQGDRLSEANALATLGYSEVFRAKQDQAEPEVYDAAVMYLQQGVQLSERVGDRLSLALCCNSLGIAHVVLGQYTDAVAVLEQGLLIAQAIGDFWLQGVNLGYLGDAHRNLGNTDKAVFTACLGMYLLYQIDAEEWRQPARMLLILDGQLGRDRFLSILQQYRSELLRQIGVDGYDYLPELLQRYRDSL